MLVKYFGRSRNKFILYFVVSWSGLYHLFVLLDSTSPLKQSRPPVLPDYSIFRHGSGSFVVSSSFFFFYARDLTSLVCPLSLLRGLILFYLENHIIRSFQEISNWQCSLFFWFGFSQLDTRNFNNLRVICYVKIFKKCSKNLLPKFFQWSRNIQRYQPISSFSSKFIKKD